MSYEHALSSAREKVDQMWTAQGHEAQHNAACHALRNLMVVVEKQAIMLKRLDDEMDARAEAKMLAGQRG